MKKSIQHILWLIVPFFSLLSCTKYAVTNAENGEQGLPVTIYISASGTRSDGARFDPDDYHIGSLRVMGFRRSDHTLAFNRVVTTFNESGTDENITRTASLQVLTGTFTFVFIANDTGDAALSTTLNDPDAVPTLDKLRELSFSAQAFNQTSGLPMVTLIENVMVVGDDKIVVDGVPNEGLWNVALERLAVRVEVELEMSDAFAQGAELSFTNMPDRVYLVQQENIATRTTRTVSEAPTETNDGSGITTLVWERIILPETWFTDRSDESRAVEVCLTQSGDTKKAPPGKSAGQRLYHAA